MGMGVRHRTRHRWNSQSQWVGVLSGLRSNCEVLPRRTVIEMYRQLRAYRAADEPQWDLTAILENNHPARRLLESGIPGMPRYTRVSRATTFTFKALHSSRFSSLPISSHPVSLEVSGNICKVERISGYRSIVSGYAPFLARLRPWVNPVLSMFDWPTLPKPATELQAAFVVDAEWIPKNHKVLADLIVEIRRSAAHMGADLIHWGIPSNHPDAAWLGSKLRAWETHSIVYAVHEPEIPPPVLVDFWPEVSRL